MNGEVPSSYSVFIHKEISPAPHESATCHKSPQIRPHMNSVDIRPMTCTKQLHDHVPDHVIMALRTVYCGSVHSVSQDCAKQGGLEVGLSFPAFGRFGLSYRGVRLAQSIRIYMIGKLRVYLRFVAASHNQILASLCRPHSSSKPISCCDLQLH